MKSRGVASNPSASFAQARTREEVYVATLKKLQLAEALGKVVRHEDVMTAAFDTYRAVRDQLFSIPDRVSAEFAVENDRKKIRKTLVKEFELALNHVRIEGVGSPGSPSKDLNLNMR